MTTSSPNTPRRPHRSNQTPQLRGRGAVMGGHWQRFGYYWLALFFLLALLFVLGLWLLDDPQATVTIRTRDESVSTQLTAELIVGLNQADWDSQPVRLPLKIYRFDSDLTATVTATNQDLVGNYAGGDMTIINCQPFHLTIPNQTIVRREGLSFVTLESIDLSPSNADCDVLPGTSAQIRVRATQFGSDYNLEPGSYEIANLQPGSYRANGGKMIGGSQRQAAVINQSDIDRAIKAVDDQRDDELVAAQLDQEIIADGHQSLAATFVAVAQKPKSTVEVGDEVSQGQITLTVSYQVGAVASEQLRRLAQTELAPKAGNLAVVDNGLETADYRLTTPTTGDVRADYLLEVDIFEARIGLGLDQETLFERIANQPRKLALADLRRLPGVVGAEIEISPFWRNNVPADPTLVEIIIEPVGLEQTGF